MMRRLSSHAVHLIAEVALGLALLAAVTTGALAWRLRQGPIDITGVARRLESWLPPSRVHLTIGSAALAWEGFADVNSPLDIRWEDLTITEPGGTDLARLPHGRVTLDLPHLLLGRLVPRLAQVDDAVITLVRQADGSTRLALGGPEAAILAETPTTQATAPKPAASSGGARLIAALATPDTAQDPATHPLSALNQLRHLGIHNASVTFKDARLGVIWQASGVNAALNRATGGGMAGHAQAQIKVGDVTSTLTATASLTASGTHMVASSTPVLPYALALSAPIFAPLAAIDAPTSVSITADLTPELNLHAATVLLRAGPGALNTGRGKAPIDSAALDLRTDGTNLDIPTLRLDFHRPPGAVADPPVLTAHAHAEPRNGVFQADFSADIASAAFADLPFYWPYGIGGGGRAWITENITGGTAHDAHAAGQMLFDPRTGDAKLTSLTGGLTGSGVAIAWLRPVPPLENATAKLVLQGPDALLVTVDSATQGAIALSDGSVRITGLAGKDQNCDIQLKMSGGLADTLALLSHPRLNLLSRHPLEVTAPAGQVRASLHVTLPLRESLTTEDLGISAHAALTDVHLGHVVVGRDLDAGQLTLDTTSQSLRIAGKGILALVPSALAVEMDFRPGPPSQVLEHYTANGIAGPAAMLAAGLPPGVMTAGTAGITGDYALRRDGIGTIALAADLTNAAITTPLGWHKTAGQPATTSARLLLHGNVIAGFDRIQAQGPDLAITSHADMADGLPTKLYFDQFHVARTTATGSITLPSPGHKAKFVLHGAVLDLSNYLAQRDRPAATPPPGDQPAARRPGQEQAAGPPDDEDAAGPPWQADLNFGQIILARDTVLAPAAASIDSDGLHLNHLNVTAGTRGEIRATIVAAPGGRKLTIDSADAGAVLLAAGVANNIRGGTLRVDGTYADDKAHAPLTGTATLADFRVTNAPGLGRLLQAMTLYGAVDLLKGPGLGFRRAIVPFTWQQRVLRLDEARAFSASIGLTAQGAIDLRAQRLDLTGTVVPAYFFNQMLGNIPLLGPIFSPEKGGGVFAASYAVKGKLSDPQVTLNPLAALTPGILRNIFKIF